MTALCLDDRQRKFIVGSHNGRIEVYDYMHGSVMKEFTYKNSENKAHLSEVTALLYNDEHKVVISASWDRNILIHDEMDPEEGILLRKMSGGHTSDITSLAYSFNTSLIASGSSDCTIQLWDFEFARLEGTLEGHQASVTTLHFLDPFPVVVSSDSNGLLNIWAVRPAPNRLRNRCLARFGN